MSDSSYTGWSSYLLFFVAVIIVVLFVLISFCELDPMVRNVQLDSTISCNQILLFPYLIFFFV